MHRFLLTAAVLVFFGVCGCEPQTPSPSPRTPDRSRPTPRHQVLVLAFTADWCQACRRDKPTLTDLKRRGVEVVEINCDARPDLVTKYQVRRLPTYIVLRDGKEVERTQSILLLIRILRFILRLF